MIMFELQDMGAKVTQFGAMFRNIDASIDKE